MTKVELLPHEFDTLRDLSETLAAELLTLASEKAEAQGPSFDWHDNPGLDIVDQAQAMSRGRAIDVKRLLDHGESVDYPKSSDKRIRLGSLVVGRAEFGPLPFLMVGQLITGADYYRTAWETTAPEEYRDTDLAVITRESPMGSVALGTRLDSVIKYSVNERRIDLKVEYINQEWLTQLIAEKS